MDFGVYTPELRELLDGAMYGPLPAEQIRKLPLHTRCRLIRHMTMKILTSGHVDWNALTEQSLAQISKSFDVSDAYVAWQEKRANQLLRQLKQKPYRQTLNVFRHWAHASDHQRKEALQTTTRAHQRIFTEGVAAPLPVAHVFVNTPPRRFGKNTHMIYSTFTGDIDKAKGRIKQNTHPWVFDYPHSAIEAAHHEMSHAMHFTLAVEYHYGRIRPDHPLHEDARYFHAMEVRKAGVPPTIPDVYNGQTFEVLAAREGASLAKAIYTLAC